MLASPSSASSASSASSPPASSVSSAPASSPSSGAPLHTHLQQDVYLGIPGKQAAVLRFLDQVARHADPITLYLYSDESMEWMTESPAFAAQWRQLLTAVILRGHKIKIIHNVERDITEMLAAIEKWMPLYMTGAISPFYYPKYRENIFHRTMFIAPEIAAVTAFSIGEVSPTTPNYYHSRPEVLEAITLEFEKLLSYCRPLMKIFTAAQQVHFESLQEEYDEAPGESIAYSNHFFLATLPESAFLRMLGRINLPKERREEALRGYQARRSAFFARLGEDRLTQLIALPQKQDYLQAHGKMQAEGQKVSLSGAEDGLHSTEMPENPLAWHPQYSQLLIPTDCPAGITLAYSEKDWQEHKAHLAHLLRTQPNFQLYFVEPIGGQKLSLCAKEDVGAIIAKQDAPSIIFAFNQASMTRSLASYLEDLYMSLPARKRDRRHTLSTLEVK